MTTFAKFSSVFMFYREQSNQNVIGLQTFLVYGMSGSFWQACAIFRRFWALREEIDAYVRNAEPNDLKSFIYRSSWQS